jgi:hypothetical protein
MKHFATRWGTKFRIGKGKMAGIWKTASVCYVLIRAGNVCELIKRKLWCSKMKRIAQREIFWKFRRRESFAAFGEIKGGQRSDDLVGTKSLKGNNENNKLFIPHCDDLPKY